MNVRLDEYLVLSRASYIFNVFRHSGVKYVNCMGEEHTVRDLEHVIPESNDDYGYVTPTKAIFDMTKNFEFILESIIEGLSIDKYVLCRTDKTMEYILVANFPHKRADNGEVIDVQIPFMFTETDVIAISPFNAPDIKERFNSPNEYVIGVIKTADLKKLDGTNKLELLEFVFNKDENGNSIESTAIKILDAVATSIHMQTEYFLKDLQSIPDTGFRIVTEDSVEFEKIYGKYGDMVNPEENDVIKATDFTPILIKDGETNKSIVAQTELRGSKVVQRLVGIESFDDVCDIADVVNKEVLIRCPEGTVPLAIKLPSTYYYVGYNTIVKETDVKLETFSLLDTNSALINSDYIPVEHEDTHYEMYGVESEFIKNSVSKANEHLLIPFQKYGVVAGTKLYEIFYPVLKMPLNVIKSTFQVAFGVLKANSKLEKEKSEDLKEQLLNDELDATFVKIELLFAKFALLMGTSFILGNFFISLIVWFILKNRNKKIYIKAIERTERRLVSTIGQYDRKLEFATQESDYESVKKLTHIRDSYKAMLDKLREVKRDSLGKADKYTDTYAEYNRD